MLLTPPSTPSKNLGMAVPAPSEPPAPPGSRAQAGVGVSQASSSHPGTLRRTLSNAEAALYFPSREDGAHDVYLHLNISSASSLATEARVRTAWALQLCRHPLLAAHMDMRGYEDVSFVHTPPGTVTEALHAADARLAYYRVDEGPEDLVDVLVNGPRVLAGDTLAHLTVRRGGARDADMSGAGVPAASSHGVEIILTAASHVADYRALHVFTDELLSLLSAPSEHLTTLLAAAVDRPIPLPISAEERLGLSHLQRVAGAIISQRRDSCQLGGQSFPVLQGRPRYTAVPTRIYSAEQTSIAQRHCAAHGVSLADTVIALCAVAWSRRAADTAQPTLISTVADLRPAFGPPGPASFMYLAEGTRRILLPTQRPSPPRVAADMVWHRAKQVRRQLAPAAAGSGSKRARVEGAVYCGDAAARAWRARVSAREDDNNAAAQDANPGLGLGIVLPARPAPAPATDPANTPPPPPAAACLLHVAAFGDLDATYHHERHAMVIESVLAGSRLAPRDILVTGHTVRGKLHLSLNYDVNGFVTGAVEKWWGDVLALASQVLLYPALPRTPPHRRRNVS